MLKSAVAKAKLGSDEELAALRRLDAQARLLERNAEGSSVEALIAEERRASSAYGGRSVFGWERAEASAANSVSNRGGEVGLTAKAGDPSFSDRTPVGVWR